VLVGREDAFCSVDTAEQIHAGIAGSTLLVMEESGHFPWIEQPAEFFEAVAAFLR
jgi:proline iminopeptidase